MEPNTRYLRFVCSGEGSDGQRLLCQRLGNSKLNLSSRQIVVLRPTPSSVVLDMAPPFAIVVCGLLCARKLLVLLLAT
jgi:hypothetical protein